MQVYSYHLFIPTTGCVRSCCEGDQGQIVRPHPNEALE